MFSNFLLSDMLQEYNTIQKFIHFFTKTPFLYEYLSTFTSLGKSKMLFSEKEKNAERDGYYMVIKTTHDWIRADAGNA